MILLDQDDEVKQGDFGREEPPDPNIYQPDVEQDDDAEFDRRIRQVHERLQRLSIVGAPDIEVEGAWDSGYAVKGRFKESGQGQAGPTGPTGPTGACCVGADCSITSSVYCGLIGGTYQGDGTDCTPNPCPQPTGACCVGSDCSIQTESDCSGMGGTYQGDDTVCDPNPCPCPCGFDDFYGSGRKFLTKTTTKHVVKIQSCLNSDPTLTCERGTDATYIFTDHYESDCSITSTVDLLGDAVFLGGFYEETYHNCDGGTIHDSAPECIPGPISATESYCTLETDFNHPPCTPVDTSLITTIDVVLSDECIP